MNRVIIRWFVSKRLNGCEQLDSNDRVVATTGMPARELYEFRVARGDGTENDFLTVGSMGHAASIAQGLARSQPGRRLICLDGDGSVLMHMGSLAIVGQSQQENLLHVVLNNGAHDSVGGQPTCAFAIDLSGTHGLVDIGRYWLRPN